MQGLMVDLQILSTMSVKGKLHKTMQGSNFLRGDLIKTVQEPHSTLDMTNILKD